MISEIARGVASLVRILTFSGSFGYAQEGWWMREPIRRTMLIPTCQRRSTESCRWKVPVAGDGFLRWLRCADSPRGPCHRRFFP